MTESMVERCAKAVYDATDPLSQDAIATVIISSDHLFPSEEHLKGNPTSKAYQLAAMEVCRAAARAVLEALKTPTPEMGDAGDAMLEQATGRVFSTTVTAKVFRAMIQAALDKGEGR